MIVRAGDIIRERREELGLSGRELAKLAHVNHGDLSRVETGQKPPSATLAAQVCRVLGLKLADVYEAEDGTGDDAPAEDMVQEIRAILIRGRWPPLAREGLINLARATKPGEPRDPADKDGFFYANKRLITQVS
jgi:transcriptional regulator with XRE-family HTH domain